MGGYQRTVVIVDQQTFCYSHPTGLVEFIVHERFVQADPAYVKNFFAKLSTKDELFAPTSYGLVLIDVDNKRLFSGQGFDGYREVHFAKLWLYANESVIIPKHGGGYSVVGPGHPSYFPDQVRRLYELGMIGALEATEQSGEYYIEGKYRIIEQEPSFDDVYARMDGQDDDLYVKNRKYPRLASFPMLWAKHGWDFREYGDGSRQMLADVRQLYALSEADIAAWEAYNGDDEEEVDEADEEE